MFQLAGIHQRWPRVEGFGGDSVMLRTVSPRGFPPIGDPKYPLENFVREPKILKD